mmetsp:Transcript_10429/g.32097  ORF Transcript_10429/g.32097 Transcript_10429/m.32097 type:complete len:150 (+) Transcript_10429:1112-1561(+)
MSKQLRLFFSLCFVCTLLACLVVRVASESEAMVNLRPAVDDTAVVTKGSVTCTFSYSVVGGSSEEWFMELIEDSGVYRCHIQRPEKASYLYFLRFEATLSGVSLGNVEVWDNSASLLQEEAFVVDRSGGVVSQASGWSGTIHQIILDSA